MSRHKKNNHYRIGTRASLLAVAQCTLLKEQLESRTGEKFELVKIQTQGDQQTDKPLWQLEGKDFFTKELDYALLSGDVDMVVHSYKDLGSDRPQGIALGAITQRQFHDDILLVRSDVVESLCRGDFRKDLVVGTSSPRRIVNIESELSRLLPHANKLHIRCETLRGNVNTRIQKLKSHRYHAIVLALAGLERLAQYEPSRPTLERLLSGLNFMVLPSSILPSAASQGALAVEYNIDAPNSQKINELINSVHHRPTADCVALEREYFQRYGGGCHLAVGIHVCRHKKQMIYSHRGVHQNQTIKARGFVKKQHMPSPQANEVFIGLPLSQLTTPREGIIYDELIEKKRLENTKTSPNKNVFMTSGHCLHSLDPHNPPRSLWTAGLRSWKKCGQRGFWVNGCSDGLGHKELERLAKSSALKILTKAGSWQVLTAQTSPESSLGKNLACYSRQSIKVDEKYRKAMEKIRHCYWTSYAQYQHFTEIFTQLRDSNVQHYCGLGKTLDQFQAHGVVVKPLLNMKDLYPQQ